MYGVARAAGFATERELRYECIMQMLRLDTTVPFHERPLADRGALPSLTLRVVSLVRATDADAGLSLGATEIARACEAAGVRLENIAVRSIAEAREAADARAAMVVLFGGETDEDFRSLSALAAERALPFVNLWCEADTVRDGSFGIAHLCPSNGQREEARRFASGLSHDGRGAEGASVVAWHPGLARHGAAALCGRYFAATGLEMTERAWLGWAGHRFLADALVRALRVAPLREPRAVAQALREALVAPGTRLDVAKGVPLRVRASDGAIAQSLYVVNGDRVMAEFTPPAR